MIPSTRWSAVGKSFYLGEEAKIFPSFDVYCGNSFRVNKLIQTGLKYISVIFYDHQKREDSVNFVATFTEFAFKCSRFLMAS